MKRKRLAAVDARIIARTNAIVVGAKYFLSNFYDKDGAWVEVLAKSTKLNRAGWPSSVEYRVLEWVGDAHSPSAPSYAPGKTGTCNASNLYETRELAAHRVKFSA